MDKTREIWYLLLGNIEMLLPNMHFWRREWALGSFPPSFYIKLFPNLRRSMSDVVWQGANTVNGQSNTTRIVSKVFVCILCPQKWFKLQNMYLLWIKIDKFIKKGSIWSFSSISFPYIFVLNALERLVS